MIEQIEKYGTLVWADTEMDDLRKDRCLCLNCEYVKKECTNSKQLYEICKEYNLAMMITRCPEYAPKVKNNF